MIRDHNGLIYSDILSAITVLRDVDKTLSAQDRGDESVSMNALRLARYRASLDAIIASASGAKSAAEACGGDRAAEIVARAVGVAA